MMAEGSSGMAIGLDETKGASNVSYSEGFVLEGKAGYIFRSKTGQICGVERKKAVIPYGTAEEKGRIETAALRQRRRGKEAQEES